MADPPLANLHASPRPSSLPPSSHYSFIPLHRDSQSHSGGPPSAIPSSTPAQSPPPNPNTALYSLAQSRQSLSSTRASSSSTPSDNAGPSHPHPLSAANHSSPSSPPAGSGPTNDDIEAVIQMAMASSTRSGNPPRDTRTQLFVGNLPYRVRWQDLKDLFRRAGTVLRADVSLGPDNRSRGYGTVLLATAEDAGRAVDIFNGYTWQTRTLEVRPDRMGEDVGIVGGVSAGYGPMGVGMGNVALGGLAGVFGTSLVGSLSPVVGSLSGMGTPAGPGSSALASPAPTLARFAGLSPFGAASGAGPGALGEEGDALSSQSSTSAQTSRNLFVGNLPFHIQWQDLKDLFRQAGAVQRADVAQGADGRSRGFGTVSFSNETDAERAVRMFNGYEYNGRPLKVHFDKFAPPTSSSAPLVGPTASSPASFAFSHAHSHSHTPTHTHAHASPTMAGQMYGLGHAQHASMSHAASSLAQQLLQSQVEHGRAQQLSAPWSGSRQSSEQGGGYGFGDGVSESGEQDASLVAQLAQKLALGSTSQPQSPSLSQAQVQAQFARAHPTHIPIPPAIQSPYMFDFLQSTPTTPYEVYDLNTYQRINAAAAMDGFLRQQAQGEQMFARPAASPGFSTEANASFGEDGSPSQLAQRSHTQESSAEKNSAASRSNTSSTSMPVPQPVQPTAPSQSSSSSSSRPPPTSPTSSSSRSHTTPQQSHHHPAHPGPIALPPPPPVTAFPVPPPHTLSPQYTTAPHMHGHPMSPMHHPLMGMSMPMMTPHGLPPITPSMPSFTFLPQPSPALPSPAAVPDNDRPPMHEHMAHVMAAPPFTPFSPGVTMSPGAFWGRAGSGANPFINPAVGAPVRPGGYYAYAQPQQQQQQQAYAQQQHVQMQQGQEQAQPMEGRPPDGYFPPLPVSMAMAQASANASPREEPAGYFPWVPPQSGSQEGQGQRSSGLANEILREHRMSVEAGDSGEGRSGGGESRVRESPSESEGTTGTVETSTSSRGTSWHTDEEDAAARAKSDDAEDVEAYAGDSPRGVVVAGLNGHGHAGVKPRAQSAQSSVGPTGEMRGSLPRADSDP